MKFYVDKVFVSLSADDVKIGSKGYWADSLANLKIIVENEVRLAYGEVTRINDKYCPYRFRIDNIKDKAFFYLVEEPKEKKLRPYSNPEEMIEDFKKRYNAYGGWSGKDNPMYNPMIWIKSKATGFRHLVTDYCDNDNCDNDNCSHCNKSCIWIGTLPINFKELYENYTYLDGTPCGIKEE